MVHIPSAPRPIAATPVRDTSTRPSGRIRSMNWLILAELPEISNTKLSVVASITRARKASARGSDSTRWSAAPLPPPARRVDRAARQLYVDDAIDRHHGVELMLDLLDHHRRACRDDSD